MRREYFISPRLHLAYALSCIPLSFYERDAVQRKAWIFMARSCMRNARAALFRAWTSASTFAAHLKGAYAARPRGQEQRRPEGGRTDAVIHVADASAIGCVRSTTISWRFATMPIKMPTRWKKKKIFLSLAGDDCQKWDPAWAKDISRFIISAIANREIGITRLLHQRTTGRINLYRRNYYPDISNGSNLIRIRRSKYTPKVQTFQRFFMRLEPCDYLFGNWLLLGTTTSRMPK